MLFRSIVERGVINNRRRHDHWHEYPLSCLLDSYQCSQCDEHISYGSTGNAVPPFGCAFSTAPELQNVLAVANEEGIVRLYNTENRKTAILKEWIAHENAVFDIAWVPGEASLVTASGDQMAKLWDVKTGELLGNFKGHQCSLKSVAFTRREKAVFCTGGRDGYIMIWDTRCSKKDGFYRQVKQISGAHNKIERPTPSKVKRKRLAFRGMAPLVDSQQSVTVVLFRDENTLVSSGAVDGTIKMWDLRKNYTTYHQDPMPLQAYPYPGSSTRRLGYSGLSLDSTGSNLFSNCTDDNIYMFNITGLKTTPVAVFNGHLNSSFYVTSTVSPDDQFLASGSSDHQAYIWKISDPKSSPVTLQGHCQEVTSVSWCPTDFTKIASCSDDNTVRIWRMNRGVDGTKTSAGETNLVGRACLKPPSEVRSPLGSSEHTPTKSPRAMSLGEIASPQVAACAPSCAELPLPSTTPSTPSTPGEKRHLAGTPRRTPTTSSPSIREWCTRTAGSPGLHGPRAKVLAPSPQSPAQTPVPSSERRAKRRLDTGTEHQQGCREDCGCVSELYPVGKRRRELGEVCCPSPGFDKGKAETGGAHRRQEEPRPTSSRRADKENSVPEAADWLSAMGQKLKQEQRNPSSCRSPSATKKQDNRGTASPKMSSPSSMKKISSYFQRRVPE